MNGSASSGGLETRAQLLSRVRRKLIAVISRSRKNWKELFVECDRNKDGNLSLSEMRLFMRNTLKVAPQAVSDYEIQVLFAEIDKDRSLTVDATEFVSYIERGRLTEEDIAARKSRRIGRTKKNFRLALKDINTNEAFVRQLFTEVDADCSNRLTLHEFQYWVRQELGLSRWDVNDADLADFFTEIDANNSLTIEVDELWSFIKMVDKEKKAAGGAAFFVAAGAGRLSATGGVSQSNEKPLSAVSGKRRLRTHRQQLADNSMHRSSSLPGLRRATTAFTCLGRSRPPSGRLGSTTTGAAIYTAIPRPASAGY